MKRPDQQDKTIRIVFDPVVYFQLAQHHKFWRFGIGGHFMQIKDVFSLWDDLFG